MALVTGAVATSTLLTCSTFLAGGAGEWLDLPVVMHTIQPEKVYGYDGKELLKSGQTYWHTPVLNSSNTTILHLNIASKNNVNFFNYYISTYTVIWVNFWVKIFSDALYKN